MTDSKADTSQSSSEKGGLPWGKIILALGVVVVLIALFTLLPISEYVQKALAWVDSLGFWGPIAFIGIYIFAVVFFIPGSLLTAAAGTILELFGGLSMFQLPQHWVRHWRF